MLAGLLMVIVPGSVEPRSNGALPVTAGQNAKETGRCPVSRHTGLPENGISRGRLGGQPGTSDGDRLDVGIGVGARFLVRRLLADTAWVRCSGSVRRSRA